MEQYSEGVHLGSDVIVEPGARLVPPRALHGGRDSDLVIKDGVVIGAGALVAGASVVGAGAQVRPGSVVTENVPAYAIVSGNPARVVGYVVPSRVESIGRLPVLVSPPECPGKLDLIGGATLHRFPEVSDLRGKLTFAQLAAGLPFVVERFFVVYDVPSSELRGEHAHRTLHELLVCVSGSLRVSLTDGLNRFDVVLDHPSVGLYLPPHVWSTQFQQSSSAVLVVLCSEKYSQESYIRDYDTFVAERSQISSW